MKSGRVRENSLEDVSNEYISEFEEKTATVAGRKPGHPRMQKKTKLSFWMLSSTENL